MNDTDSGRPLARMFRPRSVALVGASGRADSAMARPMRYLAEHGFQGEIYPVNPNYDELGGKPCYASLKSVPAPVDLVMVMVPAAQAAQTIRDAGAAGAVAAIVFASGFAETGATGAALQDELVAAGREAGVRVLGPNCQGVLFTPIGLSATFTAAADRPLVFKRGGGAYVGQSGAVGGSILDLSMEMGLGLTAWVSTGNQADLELYEVADELLEEPEVRFLMLYVESIGDGHVYERLARKAQELAKPIVLLQSGRSEAGRRAAASHTGAMLSESIAFTLVSQKYGVTLVNDISELLSVAAVLSATPVVAGRRMGVVTTSGGAGSLAADQCEAHAITLPELGEPTQALLAPMIPAFGALANPVDVTAQLFNQSGNPFGRVCQIVADDPAIDAVAVLLTMVTGKAGAELADGIVETAAALSKPVLVAWLAGRELTEEGRQIFRAAGVPVFHSVGELTRAAALIMPAAPAEPSPGEPASVGEVDLPPLGDLLASAGADGGQALLDAIGIRRPASALVTDGAQAQQAVAAMQSAAAMKLQAGTLAHKSDVGGVRLSVNADQAAAVFDELMAAAVHHGVDADGVLVQEMIAPGVELIVATTAARDGFPPVITVGFGGITTEIYRDVASGLAPVAPDEAYRMLRSLRAWPLLAGYRGAVACDVEAVVDAVVRVSHVAVAAGEQLAEFEINPLIVAARGEGVTAVDVLVQLAP
ncbi:acetate--CoA ligase family protein [Salinisphaera aquimarina]|uniref:Acetate--CoA ligase family protein n=1 Tax=Salinisphaera aquimarina TaxID=2094031 RepID=A0ABV7EIC2_9GAMM